jgi:hypothetical protein
MDARGLSQRHDKQQLKGAPRRRPVLLERPRLQRSPRRPWRVVAPRPLHLSPPAPRVIRPRWPDNPVVGWTCQRGRWGRRGPSGGMVTGLPPRRAGSLISQSSSARAARGIVDLPPRCRALSSLDSSTQAGCNRINLQGNGRHESETRAPDRGGSGPPSRGVPAPVSFQVQWRCVRLAAWT